MAAMFLEQFNAFVQNLDASDVSKMQVSLNDFVLKDENREVISIQDIGPLLQVMIDKLSTKVSDDEEQEQDTSADTKTDEFDNIDMNKPVIIKVPKKRKTVETKPDTEVVANTEVVADTPGTVETKSPAFMKPEFVLPFTGIVYPDRCKAVKLQHKSHTQCLNAKLKTGDYCRTCQKNADKNDNDKGIPPFGDIRSRVGIPLLSFVDPKGNKTLPYHKMMSKIKVNGVAVTREQVEAEAKRVGLTIPEIHWGNDKDKDKDKDNKDENKTSKDNNEPSNVANEKVVEHKEIQSKSGRPVKPIVYVDEGDIIKDEKSKCNDVDVDVDVDVNADANADVNVDVDVNTDANADVEIECEQFEFENQTYLITNDNNLYDINTEDHIGVFDKKANKIIYVE